MSACFITLSSAATCFCISEPTASMPVFIAPTMEKTMLVDPVVSLTMVVPSEMSFMMLIICLDISFELSAVAWASLPISSATMANPRPCSPARAASMAAFRTGD